MENIQQNYEWVELPSKGECYPISSPLRHGKAKIAKTAPKDTAIFAKAGGPFDKLFNDIFSRINAVYNIMEGSNTSNTRYGNSESIISGDTSNTMH